MFCVAAAASLCGTSASPNLRTFGRRCATPRVTCAAPRAATRLLGARGPRPALAFFKGLFPGGSNEEPAAPPPPPRPPVDEDAPPPWLTPPYTVVRATASYELRVYGAYTAVNTPYDQRRDEGLQRLAEYCDGANADAVTLAATQPLTMRYDPAPGGGFIKSMELFVGPRKGAQPTASPPPAPAPTTPDVVLRAAGGEAVAALVITGNVTPATALAARTRLVAALEADGLKLAPSEQNGGFRLSQYGPLYTLKPRRNELLLRVSLS